MDQATTVVGLWEWDAEAKRDGADGPLAEFLLANGTCSGSQPISLLAQLDESDRLRLLAAVELALRSRSLFSEVVELRGTDHSSKRMQLQGGCLPSRNHCLVAVCRVASHDGETALRELANQGWIDSVPLLIVVLNRTGELQYVNRRVEDLLGYQLAELKKLDWFRTFLELSEQTRIEEALARALHGQGMQPLRTRIRSAVGEVRVIEWTHGSTWPADRQGMPIVGVGLDVTGQDQAERDVRFKQRALEQSINGIVIADMEARLTFVNDTFLRSLGYATAAEVLGRHGLEFCADQTLGAQVIETLRADRAWIGEITLLRKDGSPIEMLLSATVLREQDGSPQWMMASHLDITERKQQEQALRSSEASLKLSQSYLRAIFDSSPECIKVVDMNCRLIDMNPAGIRALEVDSLEQIRGADICKWVVAEDRERFRRAVQTACAGGRSSEEFQMISAQGNQRWMEQNAVGLVSSEAMPREQMVAVTRDITERRQIQAALQASEQRYRQLFETMTEGFALHELIVDDRGEPIDYRYLDVNPAFEALMSLRRDEVVGRCHSEFPSADREFWVKTYGHVALSGEPLRFEYVHPRSKREWIVLAYRTQPLQFAVLFSEVSKWRQAEQERRIMQERLMMIINNAPLILFSLDRDGRVTASEGRGLSRVGLRPGELVGRTIAEVYPDAHESLEAISRALAGESVSFRAEGQGVVFDSLYEPMFDAEGQVIGMTGLAIDRTEQAKTEAALRESEARLQLLLKYAPAGVAMLDRDLKYIAYSQRWLVDYRLEGQELLGRSHYEVFPEIPERWKEIHLRCLRGAVERGERDLLKQSDGKATWLRWEIQPWRDAEGNIGGLVFFTEDVSKEVQAEEEVQSLRNQAAHAGRIATMGEMAAGIAHELNQPLAAINLYAEGCATAAQAETISQAEIVAKFGEIASLANRCGEIIRRLRAFATKRDSRRSTVDLREILAGSLELLRHEFRIAGIECSLTLPAEALWMSADTIELQQVFINILRNALEATIGQTSTETPIEVTAMRVSAEKCCVIIRDRGVGIPLEQLPELFTPFFTTKAKGLGMGLKICATIVQSHHGEIECRPGTGGGTEFLIRLPLTQPPR